MLLIILQQAPAETTHYMIAGYAVIFSIMLVYVASIFIRRRNLKRQMEMLEEMQSKPE
jgi:CcmD family protein